MLSKMFLSVMVVGAGCLLQSACGDRFREELSSRMDQMEQEMQLMAQQLQESEERNNQLPMILGRTALYLMLPSISIRNSLTPLILYACFPVTLTNLRIKIYHIMANFLFWSFSKCPKKRRKKQDSKI